MGDEMTLTDYLKTDKLWNDVKMKAAKIETDTELKRSEYLKLVGREMYSEKNYREYLKQLQEKK